MERPTGVAQPTRSSLVNPQVIALGLFAASLWGTSYVAAKYVVQWLPPVAAAAIRFSLVALMLWGVRLLGAGEGWRRVERGDWRWMMLAGFFQSSLQFALQYAGVNFTTASNTAVLSNTRPIFVALLSLFLLHERLGWRKILGILLAFAGVLILTTRGSLADFSFQSQTLLGDGLVLLNAVSGAIGLVMTKRVLRKYSAFQTLVFTQTFGALGLIPMGLVETVRRGALPSAPLWPWLVLVYQAVFCTIVSHQAWNVVLKRIEASRATVFLYFAPLVTMILSLFLFDEPITLYLVTGALLVISGAYITMSAPEKT